MIRGGCTPVLRSQFDYRISGLERLPASGPFILAANHHNYLDGVLLGTAVPRPISFLVMPRVYRASPLHPFFHRRIGSIPVNLERPDPGAIKRVLRALDAGRIVGIFPEGPFSREGRLVGGHPGVALIALRSGVPVVPAAIHGTYEALRGRRFYVPRAHPLSVRFGAADALRLAPASPRHARGAGRGHPPNHGGDRGPPRRGARARDRARPAERAPRDRAPRRVLGQGLVRTLRRGRGSHRGSVHLVAVLRPPPLAVRPRGQRGLGARAPARGADQRGRAHRDHRGTGRRPRRDRERPLPVPAGARRHPHERRAPAHRADGAGGRQAPHGPLPQRSDRARRAALSARHHRARRRGHQRRPGRARPARRGARRAPHARLHAPAARAARPARPPPARLRVHARARPRAVPRRRAPAST